MNELAKIESTLVQGDISKLNPEERTKYYLRTCETLGLNPLTKPFDYITLNGKLTLYAKRDCTDQLRKLHNVSIEITSRTLTEDIYSVTARARIGDRTDESIGAVCLGAARGEAKANLLMKAETKAKRRVTLSICGLGLLDETEVENVTVHEKQTPRPAIQTAEHIPNAPRPIGRPEEYGLNAPKRATPKAVIETETKVVEERLEMPEMPTTAATATEESTPSYFKVTEKQAYLVKKLLKQTNLPQDLAEEWLNQHFGVTKVEDLSRYKASDAINLLKGMTATEKTAPTPPKAFNRPDDDFLREIESL